MRTMGTKRICKGDGMKSILDGKVMKNNLSEGSALAGAISEENILELEQVCKTFPRTGFALDHLSFHVPYGAIMGFVGENGAGKTTTIGCILNTVAKTGGRVRIFGREMTDADTDIREKIGVVYDGDNFPGYLTAEQLSQIMRGIYRQWDGALFRTLLDKFHLPMKQKIKSYSRGMTMKLAIAAALAHHPKLLILDEATSGLDPIARDDMLDVFLEFVQEEDHSILLSSHITSDLEKVADYITFIHDGRLIMTASRDDLAYHYAVLRCRESRFMEMDREDIIAFRKRDYQIDVLVADGKKAKQKYRDVVADHVSLEEIMLLLVKGEKIEN